MSVRNESRDGLMSRWPISAIWGLAGPILNSWPKLSGAGTCSAPPPDWCAGRSGEPAVAAVAVPASGFWCWPASQVEQC